MTPEGVIKIRSCCRKPEDKQWDKEQLDKVQGVPWEPIPGRGRIQVKARFSTPAEEEPVPEPAIKEAQKRRVYIKPEDIKKYANGGTIGCRGCQAIAR